MYYIVLCSPLVALQRYWNRWPWMTLNGHFALKSVSGSATNGLASSAFGQNCSKICRATHTASDKNATQGTQFLAQGLCRYLLEGGGRQMRVLSLKMTIFASFFHCLLNILHIIHGQTTAFTWYDCQWPWRYFKVIRLFHIKFLINGVKLHRNYRKIKLPNDHRQPDVSVSKQTKLWEFFYMDLNKIGTPAWKVGTSPPRPLPGWCNNWPVGRRWCSDVWASWRCWTLAIGISSDIRRECISSRWSWRRRSLGGAPRRPASHWRTNPCRVSPESGSRVPPVTGTARRRSRRRSVRLAWPRWSGHSPHSY